MLDVLIVNALIVDGSGGPPFPGQVGIKDGRIAFVLEQHEFGSSGSSSHGRSVEQGDDTFPKDEPCRETIDAHGLFCCPGFIDIHSHADVTLPLYPEMSNLIAQGITTFVGGNCGISLAPASRPDFFQSYWASLGLSDLPSRWQSFGDWLNYAKTLPISCNYVPLDRKSVV